MTARHAVVTPVSNSLLGNYAGAFSRLLAFVVDLVLSSALFAALSAGAIFLIRFLFDPQLDVDSNEWIQLVQGLFFMGWYGLYYAYCWAAGGKTPGMALLGLRVVRGDGSDLRAGHSIIRVIVYPFSFILGLGLITIVVGKRHRALHDWAADTVVIYDWSARAARLRFLSQRSNRVPGDVDMPSAA